MRRPFYGGASVLVCRCSLGFRFFSLFFMITWWPSTGKELFSQLFTRNVPKFSDRQVCANRADPDSSLISVYTVCNSLCIFWMHYSKETPSCSIFRVITENFRVFELSGFLRYLCCFILDVVLGVCVPF